MWMLLFFVSLIAAIGALWARFVQHRRGTGWGAVCCFVFAFICLARIGAGLDVEAKRTGFADVGELNRAKQAGIADPKEWAAKRDDIIRAETTGASLPDAQARQFAATALAPMNASCAQAMTIVENPPALPNQHVLTVRCGDAGSGKVYQVREAEAPQAPAPAPVASAPRQPTPTHTASTSVASNEPEEECVATLDEFNRLRSGIAYSSAVNIIGCQGEVISSVQIPGLPATTMYSWHGDGWAANMNAMFQDGSLISKAQLGLQ